MIFSRIALSDTGVFSEVGVRQSSAVQEVVFYLSDEGLSENAVLTQATRSELPRLLLFTPCFVIYFFRCRECPLAKHFRSLAIISKFHFLTKILLLMFLSFKKAMLVYYILEKI